MPTQDFRIYTARGYVGDVPDSGPKVVRTGVLTAAAIGFGLAVERDVASDPRGLTLGAATPNVYGISMREYNREASVRPGKNGDWGYIEGESVSVLRQGFIYLNIDTQGAGALPAVGEVIHVNDVTGVFTHAAVAGDVVAAENVVLEELIEVSTDYSFVLARIDIVT